MKKRNYPPCLAYAGVLGHVYAITRIINGDNEQLAGEASEIDGAIGILRAIEVPGRANVARAGYIYKRTGRTWKARGWKRLPFKP